MTRAPVDLALLARAASRALVGHVRLRGRRGIGLRDLELAPAAGPRADLPRGPSVERISRAVRRLERRWPGGSCLLWAMVARDLLERAGHCPRVHIGVKRGETGAVAAHAWVECDGRTVVGGPGAADFVVLRGLAGSERA